MTTETTGWLKVGELADIPRLGSRVVRRDGGDIALFRTNDDAVYALRNKCPHKGGPLADGIVHGCRVTCPLHNWVLELQSGSAVAPDVGRARTYPVKVENGAVFVQL